VGSIQVAVSRGVRLESPAITGEVPEQQPPNSPSARTPSYWSEDSAEDIGSDASRRLWQPRYHRRAELIGERRSVADVKHQGEAGWNVHLR